MKNFLVKGVILMIAIVDYGVGNLFSVEKAFLKFSPDVVLTSDAKVIEKSR